jgi:crotonobetaine/carnitine-CoA ligase
MLEPVLPALLRLRATEDPNRLFAQDVTGATLTYAETCLAADRWSRVLAALGVGPDDRVVTILPTSVTALTVWLGIAQLKALEAPIHTAYHGRILHELLAQSRSRLLIVTAKYVSRAVEATQEVPTLEQVVVADTVEVDALPDSVIAAVDVSESTEEPEIFDLGPWDVSSICFTSGTTGGPKGVVRPWGQNLATAVGLFGSLSGSFGEEDCFYHSFANSHIGARAAPHLAAVVNGRVALRPSFKTDEFWNDVAAFGATMTMLPGPTPSFLLRNELPSSPAGTTLRYVTVGPIPKDIDEFCARFGVKYATAYGQTETSMPIGSPAWNEPAAGCGHLRKGYPGFEVRIVDVHDDEVPPGTVGELIVRSSVPWTMNSGYLDQPAETQQAWRNGWFHTGDLFRYTVEDGFELVDRIRDSIRRRGENISSLEVERAAREFPGVEDCAAIGVPADDLEEEVKLVVVPADTRGFDPEALVLFLFRTMPRFMVPRFVEVVGHLERNAMQRVNKAELRSRHRPDRCWDRLAVLGTMTNPHVGRR